MKTGLAPSAEVGAEIVPYNDVYALDFGIDDQWRRAYRAVDSQAPFEYRKFDCLVTITPYEAKRERAGLRIVADAKSSCTEEDHYLEKIDADVVRLPK